MLYEMFLLTNRQHFTNTLCICICFSFPCFLNLCVCQPWLFFNWCLPGVTFYFILMNLINHIYWLRIFLLRTWAIDWRPLVGSLMEERWGRALNTAAGSDCLLVLSVRCVKFDCYILIYCLLTNSHIYT